MRFEKSFNDNNEIELLQIRKSHEEKLEKVLSEIEKLENEEILLNIRIKQFQVEDFKNENEMKHFFEQRNQLIEQINEITKDFHLTEQ
ncbi:unnamed protein product, partial [Adineta ricciae]